MVSLLLALALAGSDARAVVRTAAVVPASGAAPIVAALDLHLSNLSAIDQLPAPGAMVLGAPLSGEASLADLAPSDRLTEYLTGLSPLGRAPPADQAAKDILVAAVLRPEALGGLQKALEGAGGSRGAEVSAKLAQWSQSLSLDASDKAKLRRFLSADGEEPGVAALSRLGGFFEGSASYKTTVTADEGDDPSLEHGKRPRVTQKARAVETAGAGVLTAEPEKPRPSVSDLDGWLQPGEGLFGGLDRELASELLERVGGTAGTEQTQKAFLRYRRQEEGAVYELFDGLPALVARFRSLGLDLTSLRAMLAHAFKETFGDRWFLVHHGSSWGLLDGWQKKDVAETVRLKARGAEGVSLTLTVRASDDLGAIARKYAFGRDPRPLERYLRLLRKGAAGDVRVPLRKLLPLSIRRTLSSFERCTGANCVNAAMNAHEGPGFDRGYVSGNAMNVRLKRYYDRIGEVVPEPGDLLIYTDHANEFKHAALYVGDGYVYTKNGFTRLNPYIFQEMGATEALYFPRGDFKRKVFRPKAK